MGRAHGVALTSEQCTQQVKLTAGIISEWHADGVSRCWHEAASFRRATLRANLKLCSSMSNPFAFSPWHASENAQSPAGNLWPHSLPAVGPHRVLALATRTQALGGGAA